jgi:hypothetical protein
MVQVLLDSKRDPLRPTARQLAFVTRIVTLVAIVAAFVTGLVSVVWLMP